MRSPRLAVLLAPLALVACDDSMSVDEAPRTVDQAAIYGDDDRQDWYAHPDEDLRNLTEFSIVSFMDPRVLNDSDPNDVTIRSGTLGDRWGLCSGERFADQPTASGCSATLIDDDLVLTAGHCMTSQRACEGSVYVFRYFMESEDALATMAVEDIYECDELLVQELSRSRGGEQDYAIFRLDRPATPEHIPAPVHPAPDLDEGDPIVMIGFPSGLPAKIEDGGRITNTRSNTRDYFEATTDSFGGNSGSGVFDDEGRVIGILVRGQNDYYQDGRCVRATTYPDDDSRGAESISYAINAVEDLCAMGYPSERLCNVEPVCGDGICSPGEADSCPDDCIDDGPPAEWRCDDDWYGTGDGCDCECGTWDPDCEDPRQEILNCDEGEVCSTDGTCVDDGEPDLPAEWSCPEEFYAADDGCDCACGAWDPDCEDPRQDVLNCDPGQICVEPGVCEGDETGDDTGPGGEDAGGGDDTGADAGGEGSGSGIIIDGDTGGAIGGTGSSGCAAANGPASGAGFALTLLGLAAVRRRRD